MRTNGCHASLLQPCLLAGAMSPCPCHAHHLALEAKMNHTHGILPTSNVAYFLLLFQYIVFINLITKRNKGACREFPMNLQHLRVFLAVAEHENITRASEELVLSQPAVTKTIQSLEHEVGLELIERHGRRITLTH